VKGKYVVVMGKYFESERMLLVKLLAWKNHSRTNQSESRIEKEAQREKGRKLFAKLLHSHRFQFYILLIYSYESLIKQSIE